MRRKLLCIGGVDVDFIDDPYIQMVSEAGAPFANVEIRIARGRPNECHRNAALFWLKGKCHAIAVGYYLGLDRVWRRHSGGVMEDGAILDTHRGGQKYFGVCLDDLRRDSQRGRSSVQRLVTARIRQALVQLKKRSKALLSGLHPGC